MSLPEPRPEVIDFCDPHNCFLTESKTFSPDEDPEPHLPDGTPRSAKARRFWAENKHASLCRLGLRKTSEPVDEMYKVLDSRSASRDKTWKQWNDGVAQMFRELDKDKILSSPLPPPVEAEKAEEQLPSPPELTEFVNTAMVNGVWQSDGSQHASVGQVKPGDSSRPTLTVAARSGMTTLKVAYFFSGIRRKASIAEALKKLAEDSGIGLEFTEIDILVGGAAHDLFDKKKQDDFLRAVESGEYHMCILSPPCGSWSRANWANKAGPQPCRNRKNPWGLPGQDAPQQRRADNDNEFVHFSIRVIRAAAAARARGFYSRSLLEHPEDLGRVPSGEPASIWQLEDIRTAHGNSRFSSVAGYQCQFPGCDYSKPTRLLSDLEGVDAFGYPGWPMFGAAGFYQGPLPDSCGHTGANRHKKKTIGRDKAGGFNVSPTAAYPSGMCLFRNRRRLIAGSVCC